MTAVETKIIRSSEYLILRWQDCALHTTIIAHDNVMSPNGRHELSLLKSLRSYLKSREQHYSNQ